MFNNNAQSKTTKQGASAKRIGQYLRRWLGWSVVGLLGATPALALPDGTASQCLIDQTAVNDVSYQSPSGEYAGLGSQHAGVLIGNDVSLDDTRFCYSMVAPDANDPACEGSLPNFSIPNGVPFFVNLTSPGALYRCAYEVTLDSAANTAVAVQNIQIPENTPPVAVNDNYKTACGVPITFNVITVNDIDDDGDTLILEYSTPINNGTLIRTTLDGGDFMFTPDACDVDVTFAYAVSDGTDISFEGLVTIAVEAAVPDIVNCATNNIGCIGEAINFKKTPFCDSVTENTSGGFNIATPFGTIVDTAEGEQSNDLNELIRNKCRRPI